MSLHSAYQSLQIGQTNLKHQDSNQRLYNHHSQQQYHHNNHFNNHYNNNNNNSYHQRKNGAIFNHHNNHNGMMGDHVDYSGRIKLGGGGMNGGRRKFSNYADPCTDYLNNPMFDSLQTRRYWGTSDKSITLRPFSGKKHSYKAINVKNACKVL